MSKVNNLYGITTLKYENRYFEEKYQGFVI